MKEQKNLKNISTVLVVFLLLSISIVDAQSTATTTYDLTYDENGNLKQSFDKYIEYNDFNQIVRVRQTNQNGQILEEYQYDHNGDRVSKYEPLLNQITYYISDDFIEVVNSTGSYLTTYYHEGSTLVARQDPDGKKYFYHPDHLGSTDVVTNQLGAVVEETTYDPHGNVLEDGFSRFLYNSNELDTTDMYDYGSRLYDPFFRNFVQCDQIKSDIYNPQALNCYAYVLNNPYRFVDPTGEVPIDIVLDAGFIGYGLYQLAKDPSLKNLGNLGVDVAFAAVPFVPNINRLKQGTEVIRSLNQVENVGSGFKSFTQRNFRQNLGITTGSPLSKSEEAHHVFPQAKEFREKFQNAGINIHDPQFGARVEKNTHQEFSHQYNEAFKEFFAKNQNPTKQEILNFGQTLSKQYGLKTNFNTKLITNQNSKTKGKTI